MKTKVVIDTAVAVALADYESQLRASALSTGIRRSMFKYLMMSVKMTQNIYSQSISIMTRGQLELSRRL